MNIKLLMTFGILIILSLFSFSVKAHKLDSSECFLFDSIMIPNPRQKEIDSYFAFREKKDKNLPMFSESPIFYALLPNTKDTLTISQYLSHFDITKVQAVGTLFSASVNWDCKICSVTGLCTTFRNDSDKDFWMKFWKNVHVKRPARINNIPSEMTTNLK